MADIIEYAYRESKALRNWDDLAAWLKIYAKDVNGAKRIIEASQQAQTDGILFPPSPEEARLIVKKYDPELYHQPNH